MLSEKVQMSKSRALKLAQIHGPFARFTPEGNEINEEDDLLDKTIESTEDVDAKEAEAKKAEFDKSQQRADQEAANAARARQERDNAQAVLNSQKEENVKLQQELKEAKTAALKAGIKNVELNEEDYDAESDLKLVRAIKDLTAKALVATADSEAMKKKISDYEVGEQKKTAQQQRDEVYQDLLSSLDVDYGVNCRTKAVAAFNASVKDGTVTIKNPNQATRHMEKCYKKARKDIDDKRTKDGKEPLKLDSGSGGGSSTNLKPTKLKPGSLDEVEAQYKAASGVA